MIDWIFVLVALHGATATVDKVQLDDESMCVAYANGALSRPELEPASIQVAQCVSVRTQIYTTADTGESYVGPLVIGHYKHDNEVFIEREGQRISIQSSDLVVVIKQLRRAASMASRETEQ